MTLSDLTDDTLLNRMTRSLERHTRITDPYKVNSDTFNWARWLWAL